MSIKNKLVTAVTTAGLLAGLFGSAFVPAARAASAATGAITTGNGDGVVSGVQYFSSAVNPALSAAVDISAATDDGIFEVTISGGTFKSAAAAATGTGVAISGTVVSTTSISTLMAAANADNALTFTLVLNKLAAGSTATITIIDPDGDTLATMTATGRTAETGVISATKSTLAKNAAGDVTTTAGVEYIDASAAFVLNGALLDSNGTAISSTPTLLITIDEGSVAVGTDATAGDARTAATGDAANKAATRTLTLNASGLYAINVYHPGADFAGGTYTVTVKNAVSGAVISTYTGGYIGAAASVTATALATNVASAIDADVTDFFTVAVKDSKGIEWHQGAYAVTVTAKDEAGTAQASFVNSATDGNSNKKFDYDKDACASGKTGLARTITFESAAGISANTKPSATVTITCRANDDATYTLSTLSFSKTQPLAGEVINLTFGYVDANGVAAGYGAVVTGANYVVSLVGGTSIAVTGGVGSDITADNDIDAAQTITSTDGTFFVGVKSATTVGTTMQATIPSSSVVATAVTTDTSYNGTLAAGPKKLKATATFGAAAAGKKVAFVLESASGTVKTYYRKANASGVATYTLRMRGTWEVYATFGDSITETVTLQK